MAGLKRHALYPLRREKCGGLTLNSANEKLEPEGSRCPPASTECDSPSARIMDGRGWLLAIGLVDYRIPRCIEAAFRGADR
jgi:hypothetical protein